MWQQIIKNDFCYINYKLQRQIKFKKKKKKPNYIFQKLSKICKKSLNLSVQECMLAEIGCNRKWGKQQWNLHQGHSWCNCFRKIHLLFSNNSPFFRGPRQGRRHVVGWGGHGPPKSSKYFYNIWSETLVGVSKLNSWPLQNILGGPPKCGLYI